MKIYWCFLFIIIISCCSSNKKELLYRLNGEYMDSVSFYSTYKEGEYTIFHQNGKYAEYGQYLYNKKVGFIYYFDTLGNPTEINQRILIEEDSLGYGYWDKSLDSVEGKNKFSYVNQCFKFKMEGDSILLDSANSFFVRSWFYSDTIDYGEDAIFYTVIRCPFFRDENDSMRYWFAYNPTDLDHKESFKILDSTLGTFRYQPQKKGKIKIRYSIIEEKIIKNEKSVYYGCDSFYVK